MPLVHPKGMIICKITFIISTVDSRYLGPQTPYPPNSYQSLHWTDLWVLIFSLHIYCIFTLHIWYVFQLQPSAILTMCLGHKRNYFNFFNTAYFVLGFMIAEKIEMENINSVKNSGRKKNLRQNNTKYSVIHVYPKIKLLRHHFLNQPHFTGEFIPQCKHQLKVATSYIDC